MRKAYICDTKEPTVEIHVLESSEIDTVEINVIAAGKKLGELFLNKQQFNDLCGLQYSMHYRVAKREVEVQSPEEIALDVLTEAF